MNRNLKYLIAGLSLGLGALSGSVAAGAARPAASVDQSLEIDVRPAPGPGRGSYDVVVALRDTAGGRLAAIELDLERGDETRSTRSIPGGGELVVEMTLDGRGSTLSYSAIVSARNGAATTHRARIQLGR